MKRFLSIAGTVVLWLLVVAFALVFNSRAKQHYAQSAIIRLDIVLTDSLQDEVLVKSKMVEEWIAHSQIPTIGTPIGEVDLTGIEQTIRRNGFIERVSAHAAYDGVLRVEVSQRQPLLRMAVDGYDCYITAEGFCFPTPRLSSVYAPIVTGNYTPPVPAQYVGMAKDYIASLLAEADSQIEALQHKKVPLFERTREINDSIKSVRKIRIDKRFLKELRLQIQPSYQADYDLDVKRTRAYKADLRRKYRYWLRMNEKEIAKISAKQEDIRDNQKKLMKRYEDFNKLINFVKYIESSPFWRAEVVQIIASTMSSGELRLELVPRTGTHRILFGTADNVEQKFDKLLLFYDKGLTNLGWEAFRTISVEYDGQVVCRK